MSSNNPTSILASFSTMKSLVDAQQYQSPYQILAEFIQYIIIKSNLHSFTAIEMKNRLFEVFGFDIPEAVVRTTVRGLQFVKTENRIYHVNPIELKDNSAFEEIIWKLVVVALLVIIAAWICSKVNAAYTNAVGIVVGLIGAIPVVVSFLKSDLKKYKSNGAEEGTSEE